MSQSWRDEHHVPRPRAVGYHETSLSTETVRVCIAMFLVFLIATLASSCGDRSHGDTAKTSNWTSQSPRTSNWTSQTSGMSWRGAAQ